MRTAVLAAALMFVVLGTAVGAAALLRLKKRYDVRAPEPTRGGPKKGPGARDFIEFEDIEGGVLRLPGGRYRLVLEVLGSVNFDLLSPEEQNAVEDSFRAMLLGIDFPVQFYKQSRLLDLSRELAELNARMPSLPESVREYAGRFTNYLAAWMRNGSVLVRRNYVVIPAEGDDPEVARQELWRRKEILEAQLRKYLGTTPLNTDQLVDVLYVAYNKSRALSARTSDAASHGFLEPLVRGDSKDGGDRRSLGEVLPGSEAGS